MSQQSKGPGASVTWLGPDGGRREPVDTSPSDIQPPGVDEEEDFPQSLEEALLGE